MRHLNVLIKTSVVFVIFMTFFSMTFSRAEVPLTSCSPELSFSEQMSSFREPRQLGANIEKIIDRESRSRACGRNGESRNALYSKRDIEAWAKEAGAQKIFSSTSDLNAVIDEVLFMGSRQVGEAQALPAFQASVRLKKESHGKTTRAEFIARVKERILERLPVSERANFIASLQQGKECP